MAKMKIIFLIFLLFSLFNSIDEIEYRIVHRIIAKVLDRFSVKFNRMEGIIAEYEEMGDIVDDKDNMPKSKGKKVYNLTSEELGLPSIKELFKQFNKINFPNETDWTDKGLFDVPFWHLIVDGKDYYSNVGTDFMTKFQKIINIYDIMNYCKDHY